MIVIKEATGRGVSSAIIQSWANNYKNAKSADEKLDVVKKALFESIGIDPHIVDKILSFGIGFVDRFVNAMKWEEIGRRDNPFIHLLYQLPSNDVAMLNNSQNFSKIYNVYTKELLDPEFFDNDVLYQKMILSDQLYKFDQKEFSEFFDLFINLKDNGTSDTNLKYLFLEDPKDVNGSDFRTLSEVKHLINIYNKQLKLKDNNAKTVNTKNSKLTVDVNNKNDINKFIGSLDTNQAQAFQNALKDALENINNS